MPKERWTEAERRKKRVTLVARLIAAWAVLSVPIALAVGRFLRLSGRVPEAVAARTAFDTGEPGVTRAAI